MNGRRILFQTLLLGSLGGLASAAPYPIVAGFERFHVDPSDPAHLVSGGLLLLNELNCVACHEPPGAWREQLPGREKLALAAVGDRLDLATLREFVRDPARLKAGTTMPAVLGGDAVAADAIATYLSSLSSNVAAKSFPAGDEARGRKLYESIGCVACHALPDGTTSFASVPIALAQHYSRAALSAFLQNPLHSRPAGRMPAFELNDGEAADLAAYLQRGLGAGRGSDLPSAAKTEPTKGQVKDLSYLEAGRTQFAARGCAACHTSGEPQSSRPAKPLAQLAAEQGCVAPTPKAGVPVFSLSDAQRRALVAALRAIQASNTPPVRTAGERVSIRLEQLNCYACHEWRSRGGPDATRAKHFAVTESGAESLGEFGHLPPKLDAAGRKLTPVWLEKLLWGSGGGVRPYMSARMPRFGQSTAADLVPLFAEACRPAVPQEIDTSGNKGHQRFATGRTLIGSAAGGIACVACHGLGGTNPSGIRSINLTHTAHRVQPEYFKALLLDPQGTQPGTIMPPLFAGRKNGEKEIESIWTYLREFEHNPRLPEGLGASGTNELKPDRDGQPIVFRTFLEGAGTHAIAIGFPAKVHAAFDAFEVRWALVWRGRFLDATSNWEERAMPAIKPLGEAERMLPTWMPFAHLGNATSPWPANDGSAAGYVFKGYRLGPDGAPVFRYRVGELEVEDTLQPAANGSGFQRSVTVRGSGDGWYFRGIGKDAVPQSVIWRDGAARFEERIDF